MTPCPQVQTKEIAEKKDVVLNDLSKVEPAVKDAQQGWLHCLSAIFESAYFGSCEVHQESSSN